MNVLEHYNLSFPGYPVTDPSEAADMASMPIESTCGADCYRIIQNARLFHLDVVSTFREDFDLANQLRSICRRTVLCMICG